MLGLGEIATGGRFNMYGQGSSGWTISDEFQEDDVWAVYKQRKDFNSKVGNGHYKGLSNVSPRPLPSAARMIPRPTTINTSSLEPKIVQQSAPVNIPDWSKIYGKHSKQVYKNSLWDHVDDDDDDDEDDEEGHLKQGWDCDEDDDGDGDDTMMPPHEWIAKKLARNQISSFSVCEGVGRTLKGRDLSRVRNAVLTRTGFLE